MKKKKEAEQLLLFDTPVSEMDAVWQAVEKLKMSHDKVRKRLFAEMKSLQDEIVNLRADNERLKFHTEMKPVFKWSA